MPIIRATNGSEGVTPDSEIGRWLGRPAGAGRFLIPGQPSSPTNRGSSNGPGWSPIPGASGPTYTLTDADIGHNLFVQVKATNGDGVQLSNAATTSQVTGATAADTVALAGGGVSVLVDHVSLPDHLVLQSATFTPNVLKPGGTVTARVVVIDTLGHPVRNAQVQITPLPYGAVKAPPVATTGGDGSASLTLAAASQLSRAGRALGLFIQARKPGDDVLNGVTSSRLVNLAVGH